MLELRLDGLSDLLSRLWLAEPDPGRDSTTDYYDARRRLLEAASQIVPQRSVSRFDKWGSKGLIGEPFHLLGVLSLDAQEPRGSDPFWRVHVAFVVNVRHPGFERVDSGAPDFSRLAVGGGL